MCICNQVPYKVKTCSLCGKGLSELRQDIKDYFNPDKLTQYQRQQNKRVFVRRTSVSIGQKLGIGSD